MDAKSVEEVIIKAAIEFAPPLFRLGQKMLAFNINVPESKLLEEKLKKAHVKGGRAPAVIGLGRAGCNVTACLVEMISRARSTGSQTEGTKNKVLSAITENAWISSILKTNSKQGYTIDPILVLGDLNKETFKEIQELFKVTGAQEFVEKLLILSYKPLAEDGAGNVPIFSEFFTRGLMALSPPWEGSEQWELARSYLLRFGDSAFAPKLAFYVCSAGGGSGAGSVFELVRAQRARMLADSHPPQIYLSCVSVFPEIHGEKASKTQLRNAGRFLVQYLADFDIELGKQSDYVDEIHPRYACKLDMYERSLPVAPPDSLGIISNNVMALLNNKEGVQTVEQRANQYVAQQLFNLAYSQSAAAPLREVEKFIPKEPSTVFKSVKLDVEDLINGLRGPYATAFSATVENLNDLNDGNKTAVDLFFLTALQAPHVKDSLPGTVQGLSVLPQERTDYLPVVESIIKDCSKGGIKDQSALQGLAEMLFFKRSPRLVVVFTSALDKPIQQNLIERVQQLCSWAFPNLRQVRFAVIEGTTPFYSLSIFIEGGVIHSFDVQTVLLYYLLSSWNKRTIDEKLIKEFNDEYYRIIDQDKPITDEQIRDWLGEYERCEDVVTDWTNQVEKHERSWKNQVSVLNNLSNEQKKEFDKHTVASCLVSSKVVAAALRYINYYVYTATPPVPKPRKR